MSVTIIAEIGVNHNGDIELAKKMIREISKTGVDVVKFQTGKPELCISKFASKAEYQKETTDKDESQLQMCKKISLPFEDFIILKRECEQCNVEFMSAPFDLESIHFLNELGVKRWKIPSGEVTNLPYLIEIAKTKKDIIMSTGMCTLEEVKTAIKYLKENGSGKINVLHCTTEYPAPYQDVNLNAISTLKRELEVSVGYSDHTIGFEAAIAAVALGANVIEKHVTLDRGMEGPDHKASLEIDSLVDFVRSIRITEDMLGDGLKKVSSVEEKNVAIARKSIVAKKTIKKGDTFTEENLIVKRPGTGISPMKWFDILGMTAGRDFEEDELIEL